MRPHKERALMGDEQNKPQTDNNQREDSQPQPEPQHIERLPERDSQPYRKSQDDRPDERPEQRQNDTD